MRTQLTYKKTHCTILFLTLTARATVLVGKNMQKICIFGWVYSVLQGSLFYLTTVTGYFPTLLSCRCG